MKTVQATRVRTNPNAQDVQKLKAILGGVNASYANVPKREEWNIVEYAVNSHVKPLLLISTLTTPLDNGMLLYGLASKPTGQSTGMTRHLNLWRSYVRWSNELEISRSIRSDTYFGIGNLLTKIVKNECWEIRPFAKFFIVLIE